MPDQVRFAQFADRKLTEFLRKVLRYIKDIDRRLTSLEKRDRE